MCKIYKHSTIFLVLFLYTLKICAQQLDNYTQYTLPNGWQITDVSTKILNLGDLPLNMVVSKDKQKMVVTNNGQSTQSIQLIDVKNKVVLDTKIIDKAWLGLCFSNDGKSIYVAGGNDNWILQYNIIHNKLVLSDSIKLGEKLIDKISPTGICINYKKNILYVVTKENNKLYEIDLLNKKITASYNLPNAAYTCILSPNKPELYISCWGCESILVFNTNTHTFTDKIVVGSHPNDIIITKDGKFLFTANANDNSVSVINLISKKVLETLDAALFPNALTGSTTNALALSEDEKKLFIANADNNCLAVFDVSEPGNSHSIGFIPTGWYPTSVKVINKNLFIANGKGLHSFSNRKGRTPFNKHKIGHHTGQIDYTEQIEYIGGLLKGTLSIIPIPDEKKMATFSTIVYKNTPYNKETQLLSKQKSSSPIPQKVGDTSPIKYVFYVIKENRTYDQVLGDIPTGNGDSTLCLFGKYYTPNQHKLATDFVLLDNFYCDGEVSMDGHNWSLGGYATDYLEKNWVTSYGNRGGTYEGEGGSEIANNKLGFLWDFAKRANVSYRSYGEFIYNGKANIPVLKDHFCNYFTDYDNSVRDTTRFFQWKRDFDSLLAINQVPQLNTVRFINDHTEGLKLGKPSPFAHIADNDWAVGLFVEYLSKSSIWKNTAIFILEDDAQDGADHIDAHRSTAYLASPFVKRNFVDHTMYSTTSMLKTIELILGIQPMSQYDAAATDMWNSFTNTPNYTSFNSIIPTQDIDEKNTQQNVYQQMSEKFDFTKEDRVKESDLNEVLWKGLKGVGFEVPKPKRAAFVRINGQKKDD